MLIIIWCLNTIRYIPYTLIMLRCWNYVYVFYYNVSWEYTKRFALQLSIHSSLVADIQCQFLQVFIGCNSCTRSVLHAAVARDVLCCLRLWSCLLNKFLNLKFAISNQVWQIFLLYLYIYLTIIWYAWKLYSRILYCMRYLRICFTISCCLQTSSRSYICWNIYAWAYGQTSSVILLPFVHKRLPPLPTLLWCNEEA